MTAETKPWYRHPWVWVILLIPFTAVAFGVVMITTATLYPDDLVADDYYKEGLAINSRLELDENARERGIRATGEVMKGGRIALRIEGVDDSLVVMDLHHVTDSALDRRVVLFPEGDGWYAADDSEVGPLFDKKGIWYVEIHGADSAWRLRQRLETPLDRLALEAG